MQTDISSVAQAVTALIEPLETRAEAAEAALRTRTAELAECRENAAGWRPDAQSYRKLRPVY